jgi:predicted amidophosphoribosyltransferase
VDRGLDDVPGFGRCGECIHNRTGPYALCSSCAHRTIEQLPNFDHRCEVCDLPYDSGEDFCRNWICSHSDRQFRWNWAIALHSGALRLAIRRYKYAGMVGWAMVFGRVLLGFLEANSDAFKRFDLILTSPTFVGQGGRKFDHTYAVIAYAAREARPGSSWPFGVFDEYTIQKKWPTTPLAGKPLAERQRIAREELRLSLYVGHPERTRGKRIVVYDDIFTDGTTLNEVARALREQGDASDVCGISLCRQPWTRQLRG